MAKALFGSSDVMGRTVRVDGSNRKVTAILKDLPRHSTFQFEFLTLFTYSPGSWIAAASTNWNARMAPR